MDLKEYFGSRNGIGVFASADAQGGVRLFLRKLREETDRPLIAAMTRPSLTAEEDRAKGPKFLVTFAVEKVLPLIGAG